MIYPGYLLNPGDMFQVDPERVMYATGEPKSGDIEQVRSGRSLRKQRRSINRQKAERDAARVARAAAKPKQSTPISKPKEAASAPKISQEEQERLTEERRVQVKEVFHELMNDAKALQTKSKDAPSATRKQELRALQAQVKTALKKVGHNDISQLESDMEELMSQLTIATRPAGQSAEEARASRRRDPRSRRDEAPAPVVKTDPNQITAEEQLALRDMLRDVRENPVDNGKPYATPWRPRPYMSAFAFIPRYLEVNHNICSAVYLRHPVARPGLAEVPTPFAYETSQLAFTWYLRRR